MSSYRTYDTRFIGGELDGQRRVLTEQQVSSGYFKVDVMYPQPVDGYLGTPAAIAKIKIQVQIYRIHPEVQGQHKRWVGTLERMPENDGTS